MKADISIFIPALNEEKNLVQAVGSVNQALSSVSKLYEIVIVNDGSTDKTGAVADRLARRHRHIRVIHHAVTQGLGTSFRAILPTITTRYITVFPGDNDMSSASLQELVKRRKEADLISGYMKDSGLRSPFRRFISNGYVGALNVLFGLHIRYYNGPFISKTALLVSLPLRATTLDVFAEAKIRLIKGGCTYKEIPFEHTGRKHGSSKAVSWNNVAGSLRTIGYLLADTAGK